MHELMLCEWKKSNYIQTNNKSFSITYSGIYQGIGKNICYIFWMIFFSVFIKFMGRIRVGGNSNRNVCFDVILKLNSIEILFKELIRKLTQYNPDPFLKSASQYVQTQNSIFSMNHMYVCMLEIWKSTYTSIFQRNLIKISFINIV